MVKLTSFKEFIKATEDKDNSGIKVFDFFAPWCGPCRALGRTLEDVSEEYEKQGIEFFKVNVDGLTEVSAFDIRAIPTIFILKDSKIVWRTSGAVDEWTVREALSNVMR